jgi:hypothetical protein
MPYISPNAGTIADLMGRSAQIEAARRQQIADAQARSLEVGANAWGGAAQNIAQTVRGTLNDVVSQRRWAQQDERQATIDQQNAQVRARQNTLLDQQIDANAANATERTATLQRNAAIDRLMGEALTTDPQTGITTYDRDRLQRGFAEGGNAHLWPQYSELLDRADQSVVRVRQQHQEAMHGVAALVDATGNDPTVFLRELDRAVQNRLISEPEAAPYRDAVHRDPATIAGITRTLLERQPPADYTLGPGQTRISGTTNETMASGPQPAAPQPTEAALAARAAAGDTEAQRALDVLKANRQRVTSPADQGVVDLSPQGLDAAAKMYAQTGQLPPMGMGAAAGAARTRIINRAAELFPDLNVAGNKADYGADSGSLSALTRQRDAISAFENTASKNIDLFLETAGRVVDTGSPLANRVARTIGGDVLGSPNVAQFNAARQVAINEIAKIVSNPTLSGQLSDSARHEVEAFNPSNATLAQSVAVMRLLRQDMANRAQSLDSQIGSIRGRLGANAAPSSGSGQATVPKVGDIVTVRGQRVRITSIGANGQMQGEPVR